MNQKYVMNHHPLETAIQRMGAIRINEYTLILVEINVGCSVTLDATAIEEIISIPSKHANMFVLIFEVIMICLSSDYRGNA